MNTPLTRAQFSLAIGQGRGKALMHAKQFGIEGFRDLVLEACLHRPPVSCLGSFEADWLFSFFKDSSQYESIADEFLSCVTTMGSISDDDYSACERHCNIVALMAKQGNKRAEKILRDFVLNQPLGAHLDWCGVAALHSLGCEEDAIRIAQRTGQSLRGNSEYQHPRDYGFLLELYRYDKAFESTLLELSQKDKDVKLYLDAREDADQKERDYWEREQDKDYWQRRREEYPLDKVLATAHDYADNDSDLVWRRMVSYRPWDDENELRALAQCILAEKDELALCRLMFIFAFRPLPEFDQAFFDFAHSLNPEIRSSALQLLSANRDERVGEFGRALLEDMDYVAENLKLFRIFNRHFREGDEVKIISVLESLGATPEMMYKVPLYPHNTLEYDFGLNRLLVWLYEHQPCPLYRADLTSRMFGCKALTKELATECLYDAEQRTRETAEAWLEGTEIALPRRLWFRKAK